VASRSRLGSPQQVGPGPSSEPQAGERSDHGRNEEPCQTKQAEAAAGCGAAMARFSEPGTYLLRAAARQDGLQGLAFTRVVVTQ